MSAPFDVRPLGRRLGAEVTGLALTADLRADVVEHLKDTLLASKVLVFRHQHLTAASHARLVGRLGGTTGPGGLTTPFAAPLAAPPVALTDRATGAGPWVAEGSVRLAPSRLISFRMAGLGPTGGEAAFELEFTETAGAYRDLPRALRALADHSWAVHGDAADGNATDGNEAAISHPVTRLHPQTGDRTLLLGAHARRVVGLRDDESPVVLRLLQAYLDAPHNVLRWPCRPGDVLVVDGRSVHYRGPDRHLVATGPVRPGLIGLAAPGETPLGVDGRHSHVLPRDDAGHNLVGARSA